MTTALIVFAREPVLGRVKSRLAAANLAAAGAAIYRRLLVRTLRLIRPAGPAGQLWLAVDGDRWRRLSRGRGATRDCCVADRRERPTSRPDAGGRSATAVKAGATRVVLIGTDCPDMHRRDLRAAFTALLTHDLVLAPTRDGGYCLVDGSGG
ncbi:MAG: DUF2064 domain-containing protein [Burkholderiaceae bacterium]